MYTYNCAHQLVPSSGSVKNLDSADSLVFLARARAMNTPDLSSFSSLSSSGDVSQGKSRQQEATAKSSLLLSLMADQVTVARL